ncbi:hypothetical protein ACMDB5_10870 [Flavobacterium sp. W1B]|uniref:hypothetical protein n=1 Tax=Flavobacterium sp. W1B TaxID=3394146 RepID=UPI0039BCBB37
MARILDNENADIFGSLDSGDSIFETVARAGVCSDFFSDATSAVLTSGLVATGIFSTALV